MTTFTFEKLFTFELPDDANQKKKINSAAFGEVNRWLHSEDRGRIASFLDRLFGWSTECEWRYWETSKGKWTKRFASAYYKRYGEGIPDEIISKIGEMLSRHIISDKTIYYTLSKQAWEYGSFELDRYSPDGRRPGPCWWGEHNDSRVGFLKDDNGFSVKLYESPARYSNDHNHGIGRCWGYKVNSTDFVIFNAYGPLRLEKIAGVLAETFGLAYKKIRIDSEKDERGKHLLYINQGEYNNEGRQGGKTGIGYYIGKNVDTVDSFQLPDVRIRDAVCPSCGKECFAASLRTYTMKDYSTKLFCNECIKNIFICRRCDHAEYNNQGHNVHGDMFCQFCYGTLPTCTTHGKVYSTVANIFHTQRTFCGMCREEGIVDTCRGCMKTKDAHNIKHIKLPEMSIKLCLSCKSKVGKYA